MIESSVVSADSNVELSKDNSTSSGVENTAPRHKLRIGEYLVSKGFIKEDAVTFALEEQKITKEKLGKILVRNGFITQKLLIDTIHLMNMNQLSNEQTMFTQCPPEVLIEYRIVVLAETEEAVYVGSFSDEWEVRKVLEPYYPNQEIIFHGVEVDFIDEYLDHIELINRNDGSLIDRFLRQALRDKVSDVHIIPRKSTYTVLFRYLGVLKHYHEGDMDEFRTLVAQVKDRSRLDLAEQRIPQDGAFQVDYNGRMVDMRVATVPTVDGEKIVIRLLDPDSIKPNLNDLGITLVDKWRSAFSNADGLCLICGPTGSGKTTTLNGTVREMDRFGKCINTLEDPVEYQIPYVTQVNINHVVGLDFARGVKCFMRADPDVIIVGEIRDMETAQNAMKAAETGHLVMGTLHTGSILGAIDRLKDIGVNVRDLRYLLRGILVQRLIRTFCRHCGGNGCGSCMGTGFGARTIVSEVEYFNTLDEVDRLLAGERWWPSMLDDAVSKVHDGLTSVDELTRVFGEQGRIAYHESLNKL